jgi:uncharacterized transporter YbjL
MFAITTKVKLAAGIAAGALTLGAAGAYAAANANSTVPVVTQSTTLTGANGATITLSTVTQSPKAFPTTAFKNEGQCTAWFATNKDYAPQTNASTISKNFHGKLMSSIKSFCAKDVTTTTAKTDSTDSADASQSAAPETAASDQPSGASHGHGNGHSKHVHAND